MILGAHELQVSALLVRTDLRGSGSHDLTQSGLHSPCKASTSHIMFVVEHSCFCLCLNDRYYPPDYDPSQESLNKGDENYTYQSW